MNVQDEEPGAEDFATPTEGGQLRCPVCGMIRPSERFTIVVVEEHELERLERTSLGGRRGFHLEHYELTEEDVVALQECLIAALGRVRAYAEEIGAEVLEVDLAEDEF